MKPQFCIANEKFEQLKKDVDYLSENYTFEVVKQLEYNTYFYCHRRGIEIQYTSTTMANALVRNGAELNSWE